MRKNSALWPTLSAGLLVIAGLGSLAMGTANPATASDPPDDALTKALAPEFSAPQSGADVLPDFLLKGPQSFEDVLAASTRDIGTVDGVRYWIAIDNRGWTCLIALQPGPDELASMTCDTSENIWKKGLALQVATSARSVRSYFLPRGYSATVAGMQQSGQLLIGSGRQASNIIAVWPDKNAHAFTTPAGHTAGADVLHLPALPAADGSGH